MCSKNTASTYTQLINEKHLNLHISSDLHIQLLCSLRIRETEIKGFFFLISSLNEKYCRVFTLTGWGCWKSWEGRADDRQESSRVFKTGQKMGHHLHRDVGFRSSVSSIAAGTGLVSRHFDWLINLKGEQPEECLCWCLRRRTVESRKLLNQWLRTPKLWRNYRLH